MLSSVNGRLFWEPGPNKNTAAREAAKVAVFFLCLAHLGPSQMVRITVTPGGESMKSKSPWTELVETLRRFFFNVFFATQMSQARLNCPACSIMFLDTDHTPTSYKLAVCQDAVQFQTALKMGSCFKDPESNELRIMQSLALEFPHLFGHG